MKSRKAEFRSIKLSLSDLLGREYVNAVFEARTCLAGGERERFKALATKKVDFFPVSTQRRLAALLPRVGSQFCRPLRLSADGATTSAFADNTNTASAPLSGFGYFRLAEDGRLYLISKSEHYHASLGHSFPGYQLVENARALGIPNATHNNTRGHITRILEEELIRTAAGLSYGDSQDVERLRKSKSKAVLNRVLNLQTGSLAAGAAIKLVLSRFHQAEFGSAKPKYEDRIPVLVVIGDDDGQLHANYHGTTVLAQMMRGMWQRLSKKMEGKGGFLIRCVRPNNTGDLEGIFEKYETAPHKIAGLFHELVMMNYGGLRLKESFIRRAYALCKKHDVPTVVDEIQSCVWGRELYLFREYRIRPTMAAVGKGFSGGEFAGSRILFNADWDSLPQFGALVTNGQEELASLSYLITMRWAEANADVTSRVGDYYEERLQELAGRHKKLVNAIEGRRHLAGIYFNDVEAGKAFAKRLNACGLDISVQTYKKGCPPSALTKLPIIVDYQTVDFIIDKMDSALAAL